VLWYCPQASAKLLGILFSHLKLDEFQDIFILTTKLKKMKKKKIMKKMLEW